MQSACLRGPLLQSLSQKYFEGASLKQAGLGGADTSHKPAINPTFKTTKEVPVQE